MHPLSLLQTTLEDRIVNNKTCRRIRTITVSLLILGGVVVLFSLYPALKTFFEDWVKVFTSIGYIAGTIALFVTLYGIHENKKRALAENSRQIFNKGQELMEKLRPQVMKLIRKGVAYEKLSNGQKEDVDDDISKILRFYDGASDEWDFDNIDRNHWNEIRANLHMFLSYPLVKRYWIENIKGNIAWGEAFRRICNEYFKNKEEQK
jgi:hypothetical protein